MRAASMMSASRSGAPAADHGAREHRDHDEVLRPLEDTVARRGDAGDDAVKKKKEEEAAAQRERQHVILALSTVAAVLAVAMVLGIAHTQGFREPFTWWVWAAFIALFIGLACYGALSGIEVFHQLEQEPTFDEERRAAQYNKFMELLRDVKGSLMNRGDGS